MGEGKRAGKRVLMVVSNPAKNTQGWPVGFWGCELTHPYYEFTEAGYSVEIASPKGGKVALDAWSDPRNKEGYETRDLITMGFLNIPELAGILKDTKALGQLTITDYDALFLCGGQAPMFTFRKDTVLKGAIRAAWEADKVVTAICHGVSSLLDVKL